MKRQPSKNNTTDQVQRSPTPQIPGYYLIVLIFLVGILSYSNTFYVPFVFDDRNNIIDNYGIHLRNFSPAELGKLGRTLLEKERPVALASFALNYYLGGLDTFTYHIVNILIHLLSASLVYLFLIITLNLPSLQERYGKQSQQIALLCSLLFVAHPVQTQAVNYIVQRMASLGAMFYLLSCWAYARGRVAVNRERIFFYIVSAISALLAFGSKENTLTLPIFIVLYEFFFLRKMDFERHKKKIGLSCALFVLLIIIWVLYTKRIDWIKMTYLKQGFNMTQRVFTEFRIVIFYLSLLIAPLPSRLNLDHHFNLSYSLINPPTTVFCFVLVIGLIIYSIHLAKKRPLISFAIIWFWGNLVLESTFFPADLISEHRLYLPAFGFYLLTSVLLIKAYNKLKTQGLIKPVVGMGLLFTLIAPLSVLTYQRNKVWQDRILLWKDTADKSPNYFRPRFNLGYVYAEGGLSSEAIAQYKYLLGLYPMSKSVHLNLGFIYLNQGKTEQAITEFLQEIKHHPNNYNAYYSLGSVYEDRGQFADAIIQYQRVLEIEPNIRIARDNINNIYLKQGKLDVKH